MLRIGRNLVYEVGGYEPKNLISLYCTSKQMKNIISGDVSFIHTLIEEVYENFEMRQTTWDDCKKLLQQREPKFILTWSRERTKCLIKVNLATMEQETLLLTEYPFNVGMSYNSCNYVFFDPNTVFFFGGTEPMSGDYEQHADCCEYDFNARTLTEKRKLHFPRHNHTGVKIRDSVYVFGGHEETSSEIYSITDDRWEFLPCVPKKYRHGNYFTADKMGSDIFIAAFDIPWIAKFSIETKEYQTFPLPTKDCSQWFTICCLVDRFFLKSRLKLYELDSEGQVLREAAQSKGKEFYSKSIPCVKYGNKGYRIDDFTYVWSMNFQTLEVKLETDLREGSPSAN